MTDEEVPVQIDRWGLSVGDWERITDLIEEQKRLPTQGLVVRLFKAVAAMRAEIEAGKPTGVRRSDVGGE